MLIRLLANNDQAAEAFCDWNRILGKGDPTPVIAVRSKPMSYTPRLAFAATSNGLDQHGGGGATWR